MIARDEIKMHVRETYGRRAQSNCCGGPACCTAESSVEFEGFVGPSLGCGSPLEFAGVKPGETVVDLGSGAGGEVLLAARQVGPTGRAIGVDMTPEMISTARDNAARAGFANAEFVQGEIERLPLPAASADVVISNCVINLVPDRGQAFAEAYRVLRPGGRLVVSDIVSHGPLPDVLRKSAGAWAACVAGAMDVKDYLAAIRTAGFTDVKIVSSESPPVLGKVFSVTVRARKPAA